MSGARATIWAALALALVAGGWTARGWRDGAADAAALRAALEARGQAERAAVAAAEAAGAAEARRLVAERERDLMAQQLEDQAHADISGGGLPAVRVARLRQR